MMPAAARMSLNLESITAPVMKLAEHVLVVSSGSLFAFGCVAVETSNLNKIGHQDTMVRAAPVSVNTTRSEQNTNTKHRVTQLKVFISEPNSVRESP
jgi:hypothetical protein